MRAREHDPLDPPSRHRNPRRVHVGAVCGWALAVALPALAGCPAREVVIDISDEGIGYVIRSCALPCSTDCCDAAAGEVPTESYVLQAELVLATASDAEGSVPAAIRARSGCMTFRLGCDFTGASGEAALQSCLSVQLDDLLGESIADGLGFDDLDDPSDVAVILAFYSVPGDGAEPARQCLPSDLFACAGLTERFDETYDITCASCTDSEPVRDPTSSNRVAPCVGECFVENCVALLAQG
jgi:hypothetical protein